MTNRLTPKSTLLCSLIAIILSITHSTSAVAGCVAPTYDPETGRQTSIGNAQEGDCTENTAFEYNGKKEDVGINDLVVTLLQFASAAVGVAVVAGVITGGVVYSTASGSPAGIQKGRKIIGNSILGLVLYVLMIAIINFLVPGGIFV